MKKTIIKTIGTALNTMTYIAPGLSAQLGFKLFCYPVRTKIKNHHASFLNPARDFTFDFEGNVIQVYRWGTGEKKLLFLHGWQSHSYRWKKYIESISKDEYTIYGFDAPGHGLSSGSFFTVPLYSRTIHHLINKIGAIDTVVGHSIGGFSILHLLYHEKELSVDKLVIMAAPGEAGDFFAFYKNMLGLSEKTGHLIQRQFETVIQNTIEFYSVERFAAAMTKPGLIIHDQLDDEAMYQYAEKMNDVWNNSRLIATKNLGHNLKSGVVVKHVTDFIGNKHLELNASHTKLETV